MILKHTGKEKKSPQPPSGVPGSLLYFIHHSQMFENDFIYKPNQCFFSG